jgi:hypothetical protein
MTLRQYGNVAIFCLRRAHNTSTFPTPPLNQSIQWRGSRQGFFLYVLSSKQRSMKVPLCWLLTPLWFAGNR